MTHTTLACPACGTDMIRVTSHEQCPKCGFILPCCEGDAVQCPPEAPQTKPKDSMNNEINSIWQDIEQAAAKHEIGGGVAIIQQGGEVILREATGWAVREPEEARIPMTTDTIFDLASLTKVMVTAPAILQLIDQGKVRLDDPLSTYIPEFGDEGEKHDITIRNLLSHSSGICSWRGVYTESSGIEAYIESLRADQPEAAPNSRVAYSCMGYILLGEVIQRVSGERLDAYAHNHIFKPLGMNSTMYTPPASVRHRIAATEKGNEYEVDAAVDPPVQGWRDYLVHGEVHDGNAWYGMNGISGNAGLFGTADDMLAYGRMWMNGGELNGVRVLSEEIVREATREQTGLSSPNQRRGLGWQMVPHQPLAKESMETAGAGLSTTAYGHTGFTGTSMWIDPQRDLISILFTNRVHPTVRGEWTGIRAGISRQLAAAFPVNEPVLRQR